MRKIVFLLFAMVFASAALADEKPKQYDMVIVTLLDGRVFDIEIDADSYIYSYTKEVDGVAVQYVEISGVAEDCLFERGEISSMKFAEAVQTGINDLPMVDEKNPIRCINGELVMHGSLNGEILNMYDMAGKHVMSAVVRSDVNIPLHNVAVGTYIVKVKDFKLKVVVR